MVHNYGIIKYFIKALCDCPIECECKDRYFAIVEELRTTIPLKTNVRDQDIFFIREIENNDNRRITILDVEFLQCVCFHIKIHSQNYVIEPVNLIEKE